MNRIGEAQRSLSKGGYVLRAVAAFFVVLCLWQAASALGMVSSLFLPSPLRIAEAVTMMLSTASFWGDILASVYRIGMGFLLSALVSVPIGMLLGTRKQIEAYIEPLVSFIRYIPPSAFVPLSILWFGIGETQKIFIVFIGVAPYLVVLVTDVVSRVRREYIDAAYTLGAKDADIYRKVILPFSLPGIWDAMRLMIGAAWTFIILVEIVAASSGLGHVVIQAQRFLQTANVIGVMVVVGILGLLTDLLFKAVARFCFPWVERIR